MTRINMKREFLKFGVIFLITIAVVLWGLNFIFFNKNAPKSKATGETITLSFNNKDPVIIGQGEDFTVSLLAVPSVSTIIRGYKTRFNFDKAILNLKSIKYNIGVVSDGLGNTDANLITINANGSILVVGEDTTSTGFTLTSPNGAELITLTFTALANAPTNVTIDESEFYTIASDATLSNTWMYAASTLSVNGGVIPGTPPVCESFSDDFSGTSLNTNHWSSWTDNNGTQTINEELILNLPVSSDGKSKGVSIDTFDKHNLENTDYIVEATLKSVSSSENKVYAESRLSVAATANDNRGVSIYRYSDSGRITASFQNVAGGTTSEVVDKELSLTNDTPVKVKIEKKGSIVKTYYDLLNGQGYILLKEFNNYYSAKDRIALVLASGGPDFPQGSAKFDDFKLTCAEVPTGTPSCTPLPAACLQIYPNDCSIVAPTGGWCPPGGGNTGGNTFLNLKLKFQGITTQPKTRELNSMQVRAKIGGCGLTEPTDYMTGSFSADTNAVWSGSIEGFNLPACDSEFYTVYVKGPYHVQKKVCDLVPTETAGGTYRCADGKITLNPGANDLDFSGILQLVGDLPPQNGAVDAYDISLVRNCIGKTDETCLNNADVNRDGKVDTQDYSLIIASLSVKSDEE